MAKKKPLPAAVEYKAADGASFGDADAKIIATFLNRLYPRGATPEEVLEAAQRPDAPESLKNQFDWNDKSAAKKYRISEARKILRSINVIIKTSGKPVETRAYQAVMPVGEAHKRYMPMEIVWSTPVYANQVIEAARVEMQSWIARYENYSKLAAAVVRAKGVLNKIPPP